MISKKVTTVLTFTVTRGCFGDLRFLIVPKIIIYSIKHQVLWWFTVWDAWPALRCQQVNLFSVDFDIVFWTILTSCSRKCWHLALKNSDGCGDYLNFILVDIEEIEATTSPLIKGSFCLREMEIAISNFLWNDFVIMRKQVCQDYLLPNGRSRFMIRRKKIVEANNSQCRKNFHVTKIPTKKVQWTQLIWSNLNSQF